MRILITGGSGFVGSHLRTLLTRQGEEVVTWGLTEAGSEATVDVNLLDAAAVHAQDLTGFDAVVHLAGLAQVARSYSEPAVYVCSNSSMQINLLEGLSAQLAFPRVLVISTGAVYGGAPTLITEHSPLDAGSPYAVSKLTQELLAGYYGKRGFDVIIARPFNHIGPGQQRGYLVADLASQIAAIEREGQGTLTVGDLSSTRDYTDVRDVATAYASLIQHGRPGETYNVCSGISRTGEEILNSLLGLTRVTLEVVRSDALARPTDSSVVTASCEKLRRDTGWSAEIPLETTLAETLDYWRAAAAVSDLS